MRLRKRETETMGEKKTETMGIPTELITINKKTGALCIGDECFKVKYEPIPNNIAIEANPNARCNPVMKEFAMMFLKQFVEKRPSMIIREKRRLDD